MGPRIREDNGGQALRGNNGRGRRGMGDHEGRPYGVRRRGWVPRIREDTGG